MPTSRGIQFGRTTIWEKLVEGGYSLQAATERALEISNEESSIPSSLSRLFDNQSNPTYSTSVNAA